MDACYRAFASRDRRFDGKFVSAVVTTGIYCRPSCPARTPARRNVRFYPHPAAAETEGFRPCLRCRPDSAPGSGAWAGTSATVGRALRLIEAGALDGSHVESVAERLGVTSRWLRQLFADQVGASPHAVARTRRVHFARRLLDETELPLVDVAVASGFGSARRLHDAIRASFHRAPGALRRVRRLGARAGEWAGVQAPAAGEGAIELRLPARAPFDAAPLLRFFADRAIPGVECADHHRYARSIRVDDATGVLEARAVPGEAALLLTVRPAAPRGLMSVVTRVRRMFDLDVDPAMIASHLRRDPGLLRAVPRAGVRVPGAWDPFELCVRALLGQQVSVAAARTLAARLVRLCGEPLADRGKGAITHLFPTPAAIATAQLASIGLPRSRADALGAFAAAVAERRIDLAAAADLDSVVSRLTALPGFGPWTAHYVAMRAFGEPDAFPAGDLGLRKALAQGSRIPAEREILDRAERWRPWRAYAVIALWTAAAPVRARVGTPTPIRKDRS